MKTYSFLVPDSGEGIVEVEISAWRVKVGDTVQKDQTLVEALTAKALIEIPSPRAGRVLKLHGAEGDIRPVGSVLVELEIEGEPEASPAPAREAGILASPHVRSRARELSIDLASVFGTGPEGRITEADLDAFLKGRQNIPASVPREIPGVKPGIREVKIVGHRRETARRMELAARIPRFSYVEECDMTALEKLRAEINASRQSADDPPKLTPLPFLMRALAQVLPEFPEINAHYDAEAGVLRQYEAIHIGIATQTDSGLMVPVVRNVETLDVWECARQMHRVTGAARAGKASLEELSGSTITLTSLGALGGVAATPIVNPPEVAIVGPNKLMSRPVVVNNQVVVRTMMNLSSSFDHRIVDGYAAAQFIQRLKSLLEDPALIFIENVSTKPKPLLE